MSDAEQKPAEVPATEQKEETPAETPATGDAAKTETPNTTSTPSEEVKYGDEEESKGKLENKANLATGTENEDLIYIHKAKIYRFRDSKWKERGNGYVKMLRNKDSKKIRLLQRAEKTKKVTVNFYGKSYTSITWPEMPKNN